MIREHESHEPDPADRGRLFGRAQRAAVENTIAAYTRMFHEMHHLSTTELQRLGEDVAAVIDARCPPAAAEIRGIAGGAEVDPRLLFAINARTEIFAGSGAPECSVLGASVAGEGPVLAQNWDWHPSASDSLVLWYVRGADGNGFVTLTEAGILGKIGVNHAGLAVCINILAMTEDGGRFSGLPIHVVLRRILAECTTADEAERIVRAERYCASTAITVADADGMRTFEVSPQGVSTLSGEGSICHTNHFLSGIDPAVDTIARDGAGSAKRLDEVGAVLRRRGGVDISRMKAVLRSHLGGTASVCNHELDAPAWVDKQQTMASVIIRPRAGVIEITDGPPCGAEYVAHKLP